MFDFSDVLISCTWRLQEDVVAIVATAAFWDLDGFYSEVDGRHFGSGVSALLLFLFIFIFQG